MVSQPATLGPLSRPALFQGFLVYSLHFGSTRALFLTLHGTEVLASVMNIYPYVHPCDQSFQAQHLGYEKPVK